MTDKTVDLRARPTSLTAANTTEYSRREWHFDVPVGTPFSEVLKPDFWSNIAKHLRPHDRVEIEPFDLAWTADLIVISTSRHAARMAVKYHNADLHASAAEHAPPPEEDVDYDVSWGGPSQRYRVIRRSDKSVIKPGFDTREQAQQWVKNHIRAAA